jgi:pyruvate ferredoxin oxidoreductase gamma subunit
MAGRLELGISRTSPIRTCRGSERDIFPPLFFAQKCRSERDISEVRSLKEIRLHGRGGQGSVTAAEIIAVAAFEDKRFSQAFPAFGVERRGAPVMAFARIADQPIRIRSQIYEPDYVIVQDVTLLDVVDVASGLKDSGKIIINTDRSPEALKLKTNAEIVTIDATKIAMEILKRPIVNTTMLGAFCGASKEVGIESLNKAISERFKGELGKKNLLAIKTAYERVS